MKKMFLICSILLFFGLLPNIMSEEVKVERLKVNNRLEPIGVGEKPRFSWELKIDQAYNVRQKEYRIEVASNPKLLDSKKADLWDSGQVISDQTFGISYQGKTLASSSCYYWRVTVIAEYNIFTENKFVKRSNTCYAQGSFITAVLSDSDWKKAEWITMKRTDKDPLPVFRRVFSIDQPKKEIDRAVIHICGLGHYSFAVNGKVQEPHRRLDPGWTNYKKTCLYSTFDIGSQLKDNENIIDVTLGNGMFNVPGGRYVKYTGSFGLPKMICLLHLRYKDGSVQNIISDTNWKAAFGPIRFSCVYGGEDVVLGARPYNISSSNSTVWKETNKTDGPGGILREQEQPPVGVFRQLQPEGVTVLDDERIEADFGHNFAGQPVISCRGKKGQSLTITLAEMKEKPWSGHSYTIYFSEDDKVETFCPKFTYWGFQYIYITGAVWNPGTTVSIENGKKPIVQSIAADCISTESEEVGRFESNGPHLNEIDKMVEYSVRSNLQSVVTDCPHREKLGWLEVPHLMGPAILYRFDLANLYRKITLDMEEAQLQDGMIPDIAPEYTRFANGFFWSAEWSSASVQIPWLLYRWYGDKDILVHRYESMARYVDFMVATRGKTGLVRPGLGDWYDWTPKKGHGAAQHTPAELTATAFLYSNAEIMKNISILLNKKEKARYYELLAEEVKLAFQKAYYSSETKIVSTGSQAAYAFALYFRLVPEEDRSIVLNHLIDNIVQWKYKPTVGEVAWRYLVRTLADSGRNDILWKMLQRTDAPGYVHMLTVWKMKTLSETWDGPGSSMNHCMFGHIQEWFMSNIVGINQTDKSIAFSEIRLCPEPIMNETTSASGSYHSIRGLIKSNWNIENGIFQWKFIIPANCRAVVEIPTASESADWKCCGVNDTVIIPDKVEFKASSNGGSARRILHLGSGIYQVSSELINK